jgi:glucose/mannose-6-phosphate isomerase
VGETLILDDLDRIKNIDKSNMLGTLDAFPEQIQEIISKINTVNLDDFKDFKPTKILIAGMGGSAISGDILNSWLVDRIEIFVQTVRDYTLPKIADENTLVFAISYSGNTEETLSAVEDAFGKKCKVICITTGGRLQQYCSERNMPVVTIPTGLAPRAAIAYLFFPLVVILERLGVLKEVTELHNLMEKLKKLRDSINPNVPYDKNQAKKLANELKSGVPYIYAYSYLNVIATRWKNQLNENGKVLAMVGEIPEMNHNEIVGWSGDDNKIANRFVVILLRSSDEHKQIMKRFDLVKKMLEAITLKVIEVQAIGDDILTKMFYTLYLGDYVSVYLALLRELDPTPVIAIENFKKMMNK